MHTPLTSKSTDSNVLPELFFLPFLFFVFQVLDIMLLLAERGGAGRALYIFNYLQRITDMFYATGKKQTI